MEITKWTYETKTTAVRTIGMRKAAMVRLTRTMMTTALNVTNPITALSNHTSQFSKLKPMSTKSRMKSGWLETSSQRPVRIEELVEMTYAPEMAAKMTKNRSAIE
jgi:hypothetical protein